MQTLVMYHRFYEYGRSPLLVGLSLWGDAGGLEAVARAVVVVWVWAGPSVGQRLGPLNIQKRSCIEC